ncbi:hypothetical protein [Salibacter halophilus]|nr:hypothetical protein [Salibacter halophilus]
MFFKFQTTESPLEGMNIFTGVLPIIILLYTVPIYCWYWSVAKGINSKLPEEARMKFTRFRFFFFFPLIYIILLTLTISISTSLFGTTPTFPGPQSPDTFLPLLFLGIGVFFLIHLFAVFCTFYVIYFIAKSIKSAELQRKVTSSDYIGEFFLIWFFPIGVWFIQPMINEIVSREVDQQLSQ